MRTFTVRIPEVHYCYVVVEAESKSEAIRIAMDGDGDYGVGHDSQTQQPEQHIVEVVYLWRLYHIGRNQP